MYDVAALGEILIDFTAQGMGAQGQRIFAQNAGGAPANVAAAMARLGAKTAFIGKAGNDMHGRFLKETLDACGIDTVGFKFSDEYFTTLAFVDVKPDGEREFSFARKHGADKMLSIEDIPTGLIEDSRILHVGSVSMTDEPCRSATLYAVKRAKAKGVTVSYDPNYRASLWKSEKEAVEEMRSMVKYADVMKLSDEETLLLTGQRDYEAAGDILLSQGVKLVAVTLGKNGAYVKNRNGGRLVKGFCNKALDATGAGDAFWGGFLFSLVGSGKKPEEILPKEAAEFADFANATASVCVEKYGAIPAMPTLREVEDKLKEPRLS